MTRSACSATSRSCVMSTIVLPSAWSSSRKSEHVGGRSRVEVAGGFVGEEHRGFGHQRPGDRDPLLLAAGELAGAMLDAIAEPDALERGERPGAPLVGIDAAVDERQLDVAPRVQVRRAG